MLVYPVQAAAAQSLPPFKGDAEASFTHSASFGCDLKLISSSMGTRKNISTNQYTL